jgi:radical SAM superfamily enzyme YgiQ (UPF0313 family)
LDKAWVTALCTLIIRSELSGKIAWVANSRTRPIDIEILRIMKQAGCWLVAFGFESGSSESMKKMGKGATVEDSLRAARLARQVGLKIFGFFMVGFPWEHQGHLNDTKRLIYAINADFIEIHIPIFYRQTQLKEQFCNQGLMDCDDLGKDYFKTPSSGTRYLTRHQIKQFRQQVLFRYYFRVSYIINRLNEGLKNPGVLKNYAKYAIRLFRTLLSDNETS